MQKYYHGHTSDISHGHQGPQPEKTSAQSTIVDRVAGIPNIIQDLAAEHDHSIYDKHMDIKHKNLQSHCI